MTRKSTREIHFDILRILAMVLVMLFHYTAQFSNSVEPTTFWLSFSGDYASFAVALFLLMVGFFSYKAIENELSVTHYLRNRFIRLLPTFWLCLSVTTLVLTISGTKHISVKQFILNALMVNRFFSEPFVDGAHWYMLIVLVFTLFIAIALSVKEFHKRTLLYVLYTAAFVLLGVSNTFIYPFPKIVAFVLFEYVNKCFIGLFLAFLYHKRKTVSKQNTICGILLIVALTFGEFLWIEPIKSIVELLSVCCFSAVVFFGRHIHMDKQSQTAKIVFMVSDESYFVYLLHQQVGFVLMKLMIDYGVNCNIAVILTFFVVAVLASMHFYMTKLMNQRLERKS